MITDDAKDMLISVALGMIFAVICITATTLFFMWSGKI